MCVLYVALRLHISAQSPTTHDLVVGGADVYMPLTLTPMEIASLLDATSREPRSLLGYHEFVREQDVPIALVRVLEPEAVSVAVFYEDESIDTAKPLTLLDPAGLFEGRITYRRPLQTVSSAYSLSRWC